MSPVKQKKQWKYALVITFVTLFIAAALSAYSQTILAGMELLYLAFLLLIVIILIGIVFDVVGMAVTAADPTPLHAKASRKIPGAAVALGLLRNADRVSNICNDVVGDICGTLSGGVGAGIVLNISFTAAQGLPWLPSAVMSGIVAALTVGGKAFSKSFAIRNADKIVFFVGRVLYSLKYVFTLRFLKKR